MPAPPIWPARATYEAEARHLLQALRREIASLEAYVAFRLGAAGDAPSPDCPPPDAKSWHLASLELRRLNESARVLHNEVATAQVNASLWRQRRALAAATRSLLDTSEAALWVRLEIDLIAHDGNGGRAVQPLDRLRSRYEEAARLLAGDTASSARDGDPVPRCR